jgi:hypothetical protein
MHRAHRRRPHQHDSVRAAPLYRRFPSRTALLEAVYVDEIQSVCDRLYGFAEKLEPFEALAAWLRSFVGYNISKKTLAGELTVALGKDSEFFKACKLNVRDAGELLLNATKEAGTVRPELELMDILRLVGGITMGPRRPSDPVRTTGRGQARRVRIRRAAARTQRRRRCASVPWRTAPASGRAGG